MTFLETARLCFRSHEPRDEADFIAMQTDPEVRRYAGGQAWSPEKAVTRFRTEFLGEPSRTFGLWAAVLKSENKYIGYCGLRAPEPKIKSAKLAYYLARPYWRHGLATEACDAFLEVAFSRLALLQVTADVERGNDASEHILRKLGFVLTGREEIPGRTFHIYRMLREEWISAGRPEVR